MIRFSYLTGTSHPYFEIIRIHQKVIMIHVYFFVDQEKTGFIYASFASNMWGFTSGQKRRKQMGSGWSFISLERVKMSDINELMIEL